MTHAVDGLSATLRDTLSSIALVRLVFVHRFDDDLDSGPMRGPLWRSVFGLCLSRIDPQAFNALCGDASEARTPWALCPPAIDDEGWVPRGAHTQAAITLIGPSIVYLPACLAAVEAMGRQGFGRHRARATLADAALQLADGSPIPVRDAPSSPVNALDVMVAPPDAGDGPMRLRLHTPVQLKDDNRIVREPPALSLLVRRLLGRVTLVAPHRPEGVFASGEHAEIVALADQAPLVAHQLEGIMWERYSARQRRTMPLEGLHGWIDYGPPAAALLPWFALAGWIQVGGKTSFGHGVVEARA